MTQTPKALVQRHGRMLLLPYVLHKVSHEKAQFQMWILWVFLTNGGTHVWETDEETPDQEFVVSEYLEPNGFLGTVKLFTKNVCLYEIDPAKTNFSDFYLWNDFLRKNEEIPAGCDIWRPFFWIGTRELGRKDEWQWDNEAADLVLPNFGSVSMLWQTIHQVQETAI